MNVDALRRGLAMRHAHVPQGWIQQGAQFISQNYPGADHSRMLRELYEYWLGSDITQLQVSSLPLIDQNAKIVVNSGVLQVISCIDIGESFYSQHSKFSKVDDENTNVSAKKKDDIPPWESKPKRCLWFELTDGTQKLQGMEVGHLTNDDADFSPGAKILIRGAMVIGGGLAMFTPENIQVLGGNVEELIKQAKPDDIVKQKVEERRVAFGGRNVGAIANQTNANPPPQLNVRRQAPLNPNVIRAPVPRHQQPVRPLQNPRPLAPRNVVPHPRNTMPPPRNPVPYPRAAINRPVRPNQPQMQQPKPYPPSMPQPWPQPQMTSHAPTRPNYGQSAKPTAHAPNYFTQKVPVHNANDQQMEVQFSLEGLDDDLEDETEYCAPNPNTPAPVKRLSLPSSTQAPTKGNSNASILNSAAFPTQKRITSVDTTPNWTPPSVKTRNATQAPNRIAQNARVPSITSTTPRGFGTPAPSLNQARPTKPCQKVTPALKPTGNVQPVVRHTQKSIEPQLRRSGNNNSFIGTQIPAAEFIEEQFTYKATPATKKMKKTSVQSDIKQFQVPVLNRSPKKPQLHMISLEDSPPPSTSNSKKRGRMATPELQEEISYSPTVSVNDTQHTDANSPVVFNPFKRFSFTSSPSPPHDAETASSIEESPQSTTLKHSFAIWKLVPDAVSGPKKITGKIRSLSMPLSNNGGTKWSLTVKVDDGTATMELPFNDKIICRLIGLRASDAEAVKKSKDSVAVRSATESVKKFEKFLKTPNLDLVIDFPSNLEEKPTIVDVLNF